MGRARSQHPGMWRLRGENSAPRGGGGLTPTRPTNIPWATRPNSTEVRSGLCCRGRCDRTRGARGPDRRADERLPS
ncbi:hypothetical protein NDU88_008045 [Pleurodeles waltl]|uniref:Uncharacterized protein n=1 Tax=Pleurodeles waltl TaxID=8319 RepID=A0AAV7VW46_PLEWA|nr:hypothetical protein NDU88_008045 [Pleurodeles waltl]